MKTEKRVREFEQGGTKKKEWMESTGQKRTERPTSTLVLISLCVNSKLATLRRGEKETEGKHPHHRKDGEKPGVTHLFVHFNVKAVGHLIILKQKKS